MTKRREHTRYQVPGPQNLKPTEPGYVLPDQPTLEAQETTVEPDVLPPPAHVDIGQAVPVRVVNFARELDRVRRFTASSMGVSAGSERILVPQQRSRTRLVVKNGDSMAGPVYISPGISGTNGFVLNGGEEIELFTQSTVWVCNPGMSEITVSVLSEYVTELE